MEVKVEGKDLVIRIPLEEPTRSASGKTMVVASTHGNVVTNAMVNDRPLTVGLNVYYKA